MRSLLIMLMALTATNVSATNLQGSTQLSPPAIQGGGQVGSDIGEYGKGAIVAVTRGYRNTCPQGTTSITLQGTGAGAGGYISLCIKN